MMMMMMMMMMISVFNSGSNLWYLGPSVYGMAPPKAADEYEYA